MFSSLSLTGAVIALGVTIVFCIVVRRLGFLDFRGCALTVVFVSGIGSRGVIPLLFALLTYSSIFAMTAYRRDSKVRVANGSSHLDKPRGVLNVVGKVTVPTAFALVGRESPFVAAIAFGLADAAASEIGMLSKSPPRLITTWKPVIPGTNGGISMLGSLVCFLASCLVGLLAWLTGGGMSTGYLLFVAGLIGIVGTFVDSLLGAVLENRGYLNNWQVNMLSGAAAGVLAWIVL